MVWPTYQLHAVAGSDVDGGLRSRPGWPTSFQPDAWSHQWQDYAHRLRRLLRGGHDARKVPRKDPVPTYSHAHQCDGGNRRFFLSSCSDFSSLMQLTCLQVRRCMSLILSFLAPLMSLTYIVQHWLHHDDDYYYYWSLHSTNTAILCSRYFFCYSVFRWWDRLNLEEIITVLKSCFLEDV